MRSRHLPIHVSFSFLTVALASARFDMLKNVNNELLYCDWTAVPWFQAHPGLIPVQPVTCNKTTGRPCMGEECKPAVDATLTYQGWGDHIVYTVSLGISKWRAGAALSVIVGGEPALQSVGHPSGCRITESSESSLSLVLDSQANDHTCSAVIQASRVRPSNHMPCNTIDGVNAMNANPLALHPLS